MNSDKHNKNESDSNTKSDAVKLVKHSTSGTTSTHIWQNAGSTESGRIENMDYEKDKEMMAKLDNIELELRQIKKAFRKIKGSRTVSTSTTDLENSQNNAGKSFQPQQVNFASSKISFNVNRESSLTTHTLHLNPVISDVSTLDVGMLGHSDPRMFPIVPSLRQKLSFVPFAYSSGKVVSHSGDPVSSHETQEPPHAIAPKKPTPPYEYIVLRSEDWKNVIYRNPEVDETFHQKIKDDTDPNCNNNNGPDNDELQQIISAEEFETSDSSNDVSTFVNCFSPSNVDVELEEMFDQHPPITNQIVRRKTRLERGSSVPAVDSFYGTRDVDKAGHASYFIPTLTSEEKIAIGWKPEYHYGKWTYTKQSTEKTTSCIVPLRPTHKKAVLEIHTNPFKMLSPTGALDEPIEKEAKAVQKSVPPPQRNIPCQHPACHGPQVDNLSFVSFGDSNQVDPKGQVHKKKRSSKGFKKFMSRMMPCVFTKNVSPVVSVTNLPTTSIVHKTHETETLTSPIDRQILAISNLEDEIKAREPVKAEKSIEYEEADAQSHNEWVKKMGKTLDECYPDGNASTKKEDKVKKRGKGPKEALEIFTNVDYTQQILTDEMNNETSVINIKDNKELKPTEDDEDLLPRSDGQHEIWTLEKLSEDLLGISPF